MVSHNFFYMTQLKIRKDSFFAGVHPKTLGHNEGMKVIIVAMSGNEEVIISLTDCLPDYDGQAGFVLSSSQ